ncbi:MAG: excinuclease ABC subunit C [Nanohaloarchaea archaeon SW_7_43_1]|nr:MAG: excinuclease ABC subunit C [Nanohaloarchaea archaeon SW_7_43_1]
MKKEKLSEKIAEKPEEPGVYIFREDEVPIYIGKAVNIRERLRSYTDPRTVQIGNMVERADSIDHRVTEDEKEALLLEANLIKRFQPRYNIRLKDSKSYPVIQFKDEQYPSIEPTRDPEDEATVFGPFTEMGRVENVIKALRDIHGICSPKCKRRESEGDPCLDYQMGLCSAPYADKVSEQEYEENLEKALDLFRKNSGEFVDEIKSRMEEASEEKKFERAGTLRDYIEDVKNLRGNEKIRDSGIKHVIASNNDFDRIGLVVLEENTIQDKRFYSLNELAEDKVEALEAFIKQFYASDSLPEKLIVEVNIEDREIVSWLEDEGVEFSRPEDGRERILMDSAQNAAEKLRDSKMAKLGDELGIELERMECFDVSHTGGKEVVGSNVVFEDDEPVKSDYRRKKLEEKNDDYNNMYELVKWRAKREVKGRDERPVPDLILIDGGKGQLKAAAKAIREQNLSVSVLGIVKPDDKIIGLHRNPDLTDGANNILSQMRDESHRFAKKYHKKRRQRINPVLEEIDGLGPERRKYLMKNFDLDELREMDVSELEELNGIGPKLAEKIIQSLD